MDTGACIICCNNVFAALCGKKISFAIQCIFIGLCNIKLFRYFFDQWWKIYGLCAAGFFVFGRNGRQEKTAVSCVAYRIGKLYGILFLWIYVGTAGTIKGRNVCVNGGNDDGKEQLI